MGFTHACRKDTEIQACKEELAEIGVALRGTVLERYAPCGKPRCRCHADPPKLHGPYYQWTTKVDGKTKTVTLTAEQARVYETWIANGSPPQPRRQTMD